MNLSKRPIIISGPCSIETYEQVMQTCIDLSKIGKIDVLRGGIWKPRTRPNSFEGVGEVGLRWFREAKQATGLPIAIEVATPKHVELAFKYDVDVLWIGARTTVSPFAVQDLADALRGTKKTVLIKNPVCPDVELWTGAVERFANRDIPNLGLIHRGFCVVQTYGMRNAPLWEIATEIKRRFSSLPLICDPSHIAGDRKYLLELSQKAADLNYDGLMIESHTNPTSALSDSAQQITPSNLNSLLDNIKWTISL